MAEKMAALDEVRSAQATKQQLENKAARDADAVRVARKTLEEELAKQYTDYATAKREQDELSSLSKRADESRKTANEYGVPDEKAAVDAFNASKH